MEEEAVHARGERGEMKRWRRGSERGQIEGRSRVERKRERVWLRVWIRVSA